MCRCGCVPVYGCVVFTVSSALLKMYIYPPHPLVFSSQAQQQWRQRQYSTHAAAVCAGAYAHAHTYIHGYAHSTVTPRYGHSLPKRFTPTTTKRGTCARARAHSKPRQHHWSASSSSQEISAAAAAAATTVLYCRLLLRRLAADR